MARTFLALALVVFAAIQALAPGAPRAAAQQHTAGPVVCVPPAAVTPSTPDDAVPLQHATCGDQRCSPPEDCNTCPQDCGHC